MVHDFKKILFTTDLSQESKEVFDYAVSLAVKSNAKVLILHVIEDQASRAKDLVVDMIGREAYTKIQQENEMHARSILLGKQREVPIIKEALEKLGQSANTAGAQDLIEGVVIRMGKIVDEVLQVSKEADCDLIVMGNHQKSMLKQALIGTCVRGVLRKSKVPVFLVPLDI
ncbi:universal stress protein [bacterium]|nr:universal stress protein [bacterium]